MANIRDERAVAILMERVASYIALEAGRDTLITPTRAEMTSDRKRATVYVSVFPSEQSEHALAFLARHEYPFRDYLKREARFSALPFVKFKLDLGERNRQHLDELSQEM